MPTYPGAAALVFNTPLMIHEGKAAAIAQGIGPRLLGHGVAMTNAIPVDHVSDCDLHMGLLGDQLAERVTDREALLKLDGIAIIPIEGTLVHKGKWVGMDSGETSYEGIHCSVNAALHDPSVRGVVFEVDSFGGEVAGAFDVAEGIHELSQVKPTIAILTDFACSAAYLLASATRVIVIPPTGWAGSIGVITMHVDQSKALDELGIKVTVLAAGKHKAEGNSFEPLPVDVHDKWLAELETIRVLFAEAVGRFRGSRLDASAALATEAETFIGRDAVDAGLADDVGRPSEAFSHFMAEVTGRSPGKAAIF